MSELYTVQGVRPDLAAIEVNPPEGYISEKLMPTLNVYQPAGTLDYHGKQSDSSAQRDRVTGAAPTATQIAQSGLSFSCGEVIKRGAIEPKQVPIMGGIAKADQIGAKFAKRQVMAAREGDVAALVLKTAGSADVTFDAGAVVTQAAAARAASKGIAGKLTLVGAAETLAALYMALITEIDTSALLARIVAGTAPNVALEGLDPAIQAKAVAMLFGCADALVGDDAIWAAGSCAGRFAIGRFDEGGDDAHLWQPVFGRTLQYIPENGMPIEITSTPSTTNINNYYDAKTYMVAKVLNSGGVYVFDGVQ